MVQENRPDMPQCEKHPHSYNPDCIECKKVDIEILRVFKMLESELKKNEEN